MQKKKKFLIIIGCCLIWAVIIAYNLRAVIGGNAVWVRSDAQRTPGAGSGRAVSADTLPALRLDFLKKPRSRYSVVVRDIFSPFKGEVVKAPPAALPTPFAPLPTPLETFASQVRFMGFLEKEEGKTVFIGMQSDIFMVKAGDSITGKFKVVEITGSTMMLTDEGSGETVTIELQKR
ncbi:MAG: hypothetical protein AAB356_05015 [Deltaproteobacteria bacterium]